MRILGIDPGLTGGVCIYAPLFSIKSGMRWQIYDLPTVGEGSQRRINAPALRDWIMRMTPNHAFIESASSMPQQGVASTFRYGRAVGALDAIVACCDVPISYVSAQRWKKHHGLAGPDKELSRARIIQLAPELASIVARKMDHGRAEAALIAMYGAACLAPIKEAS